MAGSIRSLAGEFKLGPGDHYDEYGNIVSLNGTVLVTADGTVIGQMPYAEVADTSGDSVSADNADRANPATSVEISADGSTVYTFEGRKYIKSSYYGEKKLTGYTCEQGSLTVSGTEVKEWRTAAAPSDLPTGTVIIVEGRTGDYPELYNGVYIVEDRGGQILDENGIIDLYFDTEDEASYVTLNGWNTADIWIAEETG